MEDERSVIAVSGAAASRECLGLVVDVSLSGVRVGRELDRIAEGRCYPTLIVSDNGTELTSHALLRWQEEEGRENLGKITAALADLPGCTVIEHRHSV